MGLSLALGPSPPDAFDRGFGPGTSPGESLAPLLLGVPSSLYLRRVTFALVPGKGRSPLRCWRAFAETTSHSRPSLRCLRATASCLVASRRLRTQPEGGFPNNRRWRCRARQLETTGRRGSTRREGSTLSGGRKQKVRGGSGGGVEGWRVDMSKGNMVFVHTFSSSIQTW